MRKHHEKPIEEKESMRWINSYKTSQALAEELAETQVINISDREGDIYENWVDGERNVIKEKNNEDIRGYYTFNSTSLKDLFVEINGDIDKPKIKIPSLDSSWMSSNLKYNKLTFFSKQISFRAICKINNGIGEGRAQTIEGTTIDFVLTKDSSIVIKNKKISLIITNYPDKDEAPP